MDTGVVTDMGARRWRSGGGPGVGCAHMPVGTYLYMYAVGVSKHVAVPSLARQGAKRGTVTCDPRDRQLSGSPVRRLLEKQNIRTSTLRSPARAVRYVILASAYS
jgi:hypothetical protein